MFTGIIKELGLVKSIIRKSLSSEIEIKAGLTSCLKPGDSVSVDGACLTVTKIRGENFSVDAVEETLKKTTLKDLKTGTKVNLESALLSGEPMGGHIVNGHVDGVGAVKTRTTKGNSVIFEFSFPETPKDLLRYVVEKGPIAVDGISLTVVGVKAATFTVSVIPFTVQNTTLRFKNIGSKVNIEVDIMAKYAESVNKS